MSDLTPISKAIAGAIHSIVSEEFPRSLEPLKRQVADLRSGIDRMSWRQDQRERGRERLDLRDTVVKAVTCMVRGFVPKDPFDPGLGDPVVVAHDTAFTIAKDVYAGQPDVVFALRDLPGLVRKSAASAATIATDSWAGIFSERRNSSLLPAVAPASIYSKLTVRGLRLDLAGVQTLKLATRLASPTAGGDFISELGVIPVKKIGLTMTEVGPCKKLGVISVFSQELRERSTPTIESVVSDALESDTAQILDTRLLDANPATAARPAGLRSGVAALTATTGGGLDALVGDISKLVAAIPNAAVPVIIMRSEDAVRAALLSPGLPSAVTILTAPAGLAAGEVVAIDAADFASAERDTPRIDVSEDATLHLEDTTPLAIGSVGTPPVVAAPTESLFQTDLIAVRLLHFVAWAMRRPGRVAWVSAITW